MTSRKLLFPFFNDSQNIRSRIVNGIIGFLIILSISVTPLHFLPQTYDFIHPFLLGFEKFVISIFIIEYILRTWTSKNIVKFIFSVEGIVDILAILPFILSQYGLIESFHWFFFLRFFRILKFFNVLEFEEISSEMNINSQKHGKLYITNGEKIAKIASKHPIIFLFNLAYPTVILCVSFFIVVLFNLSVIIILVSSVLLIISIMMFIKNWLDFHFDKMIITNQRIIIQNHNLFGAKTNSLRYNSISNVIPDTRGIFRWLFNIGEITIETASEGHSQVFKRLKKPHKIARIIETQRNLYEEQN